MPPVPHAPAAVPIWQTLPAQQPLAQVVASQTHWPFAAQRCPATHAALGPHAHAPLRQLLASVASHAEHARPPPPHAVAVTGETHLFCASQQPLGHVVVSHTQ